MLPLKVGVHYGEHLGSEPVSDLGKKCPIPQRNEMELGTEDVEDYDEQRMAHHLDKNTRSSPCGPQGWYTIPPHNPTPQSFTLHLLILLGFLSQRPKCAGMSEARLHMRNMSLSMSQQQSEFSRNP